jgi:putative transposase
MTDITPIREGKVYCCVVLDAFSRSVVGWSIDSTQTTLLVLNALGMATQRRDRLNLVGAPAREVGAFRGGVLAEQAAGVFIRPALPGTLRIGEIDRDAGLAPSMGAIGSPSDNADVESFWGRMQVELFNRRRRNTRIEQPTCPGRSD